MAMSKTGLLTGSVDSSALAQMRCPVDEIGRNSVSPSTMPRIAALSSRVVSMVFLKARRDYTCA